MRKLLLVPIIHASADMGSLSPALDDMAVAKLGRGVWQAHKETVSRFWDSIAQFLSSLDVRGFMVYQDGLVADGAEGLRIVAEGIRRGSPNYEVIGKLLDREATLVRTEHLALVTQECAYVAGMAGSRSLKGKELAAARYELAQGRLLRQRDDFIAKRIGETLGEGKTGILFIGAYHDILSKLPGDIQVTQVKDVAKVREYQKTLSEPRRENQHFRQLAGYLASHVEGLSISRGLPG